MNSDEACADPIPSRPQTPTNNTSTAMDGVLKSPSTSELARASVEAVLNTSSPADFPTPSSDAVDNDSRASTPTPAGRSTVLRIPATPASSTKAGVPDTPTSPGADERHAIVIQESEAEDYADEDADGEADDAASSHSAEEEVEIISGPVNVANFAGPSGGVLAAYRFCVEYYHIPPVPLVINPAIQSKKWFIVTRGRFVGVFNTCASSDQATKKISTNCHWRHKGFQQDAVDQFNVALELGQVEAGLV
ncbi:hypothetical protein BDZ89DRAFT_1052183 [Hymenopellis radicata]|nr:hypothetical protein BDZ89DRAFT_1052183 [Hymenopellis radicata]